MLLRRGRQCVLLAAMLLAGVSSLVPLATLTARTEPLLLPLFAAPVAVLLTVWRIDRGRARDQFLDPLTGLPNRQALLRAARAAIRGPDGGRVGLILLDIDRFRAVNDTLGHDAGDRLLVRFGHRLAPYAAAGALVARMGGDEFAVLLPDAGSAEELERTALTLISELAAPTRLDGVQLVPESSAGVALYPEHAPDAETLVRRADVAMGHAQRAHAGVSLYRPEQDAGAPLRLGLLGELRTALETGQLQVHYQPKVAFDGRVVGLEALVRWERAGRRVSPEEFVGLAETSGLMPHLTDYVLDTAVRQLAAWHGEGLPVQVAVNVSPRDMLRPGFAGSIAERLARHRLPPGALQLEITERQLLEDDPLAARTLEELRRQGVQTSLDDFGTGYSSLMRLRRLPVGELKIDRSFVSRMVADEHDAAVVRCSVQLAHALGLTAVAEGVEDDATWERLARMGCDAVQGWLVSAAMPAEQATAWLRVRGAGPGDNAQVSCAT